MMITLIRQTRKNTKFFIQQEGTNNFQIIKIKIRLRETIIKFTYIAIVVSTIFN